MVRGGLMIKKRKWTRHEDEALISTLTELCQSGWKRDNNVFKSGYTTVLERELKLKLPGSNLKASPHIESRLKTLKKHCEAITDMKDAFGIEWRSADCMLVCYDDDVWEDWIKDHADAKGLRNKPFPYYDELCLIFGKTRTNHKNIEDTSNANQALEIYENNDNESDHEEPNNHKENNNNESDHEEEANNLKENNNDSNEDNVSVDDGVGTPMGTQGCSRSPQINYNKINNNNNNNKVGQSNGNWSNGNEGLVKIIEKLVKRHEEQFSILAGLVGREVVADKAAADKRGRLNGELKRIGGLSLQARLRAASMIVCDPAKIDLFYSLCNEERKEWVSMLLSGLI